MAPKAFLIDPAKNTIPVDRQMPKFIRLAAERGGWNIARPQMFEGGMDGERWLSDLRSGLQDADIIVGLGNFIALMQSGNDLENMLAIIHQKIRIWLSSSVSGMRFACFKCIF